MSESITKTPKRPTKHDKIVLLAAAESLAPKVLKWAEEQESELPRIIEQLANVLRYGADGYELAKDLESRFFYDADVALVEIMDNAVFHISKAHSRICKDWVRVYGPTKPILETHVTWTKDAKAGIGIITRIDDDGVATVCFQSIGHVREGLGTYGFICNWEDLVPV